MEIYSLLRKEKIKSLVEALSLSDKEGAILDTPALYEKGGVVFASVNLKDDYPDAITYGSGVRALGDGLYSDNLNPSVVFSYSDEDTADLAYRLCSYFGINLNELSTISLTEDPYYIVHDAKGVRSVISHRKSNLRTVVIFSTDSYDDPQTLASAFQNADLLFLISNGSKDEKKFKKALDRVIFSPTIKRLSAVIDIKSTDDAVPFLNATDAIFEIELKKENEL